ncbi:MAG: GntR family transcriptional regulator, partial [Nocardiaceae bacterium]|nr:GntR family transcriptional regulator [Nocardiaceae bacterium]
MARTARDIHLHLEPAQSPGPLRHRVATAIVAAVRAGTLLPGDPLPASRTLAADLGVSRAVIVDAYDELAAAGYVVTRPGSGTRIAADADRAARAGADTHVPSSPIPAPPVPGSERTPGIDLTPGYPDTDLISTRDWRSAWRFAAAAPVPHAAPGPGGHAELRRALAVHL